MRFSKALALELLMAVAAVAQPLTIQDMAKVNGFGTTIKFSPDARFVAYEVRDWSLTTETYGEFSPIGTPPVGIGGNVWIIDTKSGQARNLTLSQGNNWGPSWSPDGKYLAFYSDRNHKPQLWVWEMTKSASRLVTDSPVRPCQSMDTVRWTPDSKRVLVKLVPEGMSLEELDRLNNPDAERNQRPGGKSTKPDIMVYSSTEVKVATSSQARKVANAEAITAEYLSDLALVEVATGKVDRIGRRVKPTWYEISPKGSEIAFADAKGTPEGDVFRFAYDLTIFSMSDRKTRVVAPAIRTVAIALSTISCSPDGESLAYTDGPDGTKGDCYIVKVSGGPPRLATTATHPSFFGDAYRGPLWTPDGRSLFLVASEAVWTVDVTTGTTREVGYGPGVTALDRR